MPFIESNSIELPNFSEQTELAVATVATTASSYLPHGLCQFDRFDRLVLSNCLFRQLCGLQEFEVQIGTSLELLISLIASEELRTSIRDAVQEKAGFAHASRTWQTMDGRTIAVSCELVQGEGYVILQEDISRFQPEYSRLSKLAKQDSLTALLNRMAFREEFSRHLRALNGNNMLALVCIDLDCFKPVNDKYGHPIGDKVLQVVSQRLNSAIRRNDVLARLGGDEFVILQVGGEQPTASRKLAKRIIDRMNEPIEVDGHLIQIGASIGIAIAPFDGQEANNLLKNADLALYCAKEDGRNIFRYFEPAMDDRIKARFSLESELRRAIANSEFEMHYQPILNFHTNQIACFEALVRWNHPVLGRVAPDVFIPLAEETGLIVPLGEWVLRQSCRDAVHWSDKISIAVNLSAIQLQDRRLITMVSSALLDAGLPAERLELEITESSLLKNTELTLGLLHQLRSLGIRIAMDDFGAGYSSISYLRSFPFDKIKIDRSFVSGADSNVESAALVKMITVYGNSLAVKVTAEGVENNTEKKFVQDAGCDEIQGYLLSKPIPFAATIRFLEEHKRSVTVDLSQG